MSQTTATTPPPEVRRTVRFRDVAASDPSAAPNGVDDLYNDRLDVIVVRNAFDRARADETAAKLDRDDRDPGWARPNQRMPIEDIQLLGTDTPATPTYREPRGASLEAYLDSADRHRSAVDSAFDARFDATSEVRRALAQLSGGRPVEVATSDDGRAYVPLTIRRLVDGRQIGLHHDYHYPLALYSQLAPSLDTRTLVSFVVTLQRPERGGELFVYGVTPDTPDAPKMPNGFQWDLDAIEQRFHFARFDVGAGDLFLLASGRCLHRVAPVAGPRARVTMGGFLALAKNGERIFFWS